MQRKMKTILIVRLCFRRIPKAIFFFMIYVLILLDCRSFGRWSCQSRMSGYLERISHRYGYATFWFIHVFFPYYCIYFLILRINILSDEVPSWAISLQTVTFLKHWTISWSFRDGNTIRLLLLLVFCIKSYRLLVFCMKWYRLL